MESILKEKDLAVRGQEYTDKHTKKQTRHSMNTIMSEECYYDAHDGEVDSIDDFEVGVVEECEEETKYSQLDHFVGLNGGGAVAVKRNCESVSSLSSTTLHDPTTSKIDHGEEVENDEIPRNSRIHDHITGTKEGRSSDSEGSGDQRDGFDFNYRLSSREYLSPSVEKATFSLLFENSKLSSSSLEFMNNSSIPKTMSPRDKKHHAFADKIRMVQVNSFHSGAIWTMKFSHSGNYLCTAGHDTNVVVWSFSSKRAEKKDPNDSNEDFQFISSKPFKVFTGHTADVIDVAWSKSNFILSASADKTVRLWHISRDTCLQFFRHPDIVTCVEFHPAHDRYFISGCFDKRLRVWDILPDGNVREWQQLIDTITSLCFSASGDTIAVGLIHGQIYFYSYKGLKYETVMECKNRRGKFSMGCKVTSVCYRRTLKNTKLNTGNYDESRKSDDSGEDKFNDDDEDVSGDRGDEEEDTNTELLITTNDSRIRLCSKTDYSMICKYKGGANNIMQIKATFSEDGEYIICGSEIGNVFIWKTRGWEGEDSSAPGSGARGTAGSGFLFGRKKDRDSNFFSFLPESKTSPSESSSPKQPQGSHSTTMPLLAVTAALFAPSGTVHSILKRFYAHTGVSELISSSSKGDLCSRVIVTADSDGTLRLFLRTK
eukprot:gene28727-37721_t